MVVTASRLGLLISWSLTSVDWVRIPSRMILFQILRRKANFSLLGAGTTGKVRTDIAIRSRNISKAVSAPLFCGYAYAHAHSHDMQILRSCMPCLYYHDVAIAQMSTKNISKIHQWKRDDKLTINSTQTKALIFNTAGTLLLDILFRPESQI